MFVLCRRAVSKIPNQFCASSLCSSNHVNRVQSSIRRTSHSESVSESQWEDVKQRKEIKPIEFYDKYALKRQYFYHINLFGHLFIEDVLPKNITSCLKSDKFLNFFFSQIKPNDTGEHMDYPFISPCGKEMNFIKTADPYGAVVFREFDESKEKFQFYGGGGGKFQPLNPRSFVISSQGRLYHELTEHRHAKDLGSLALVRSQVALSLCENNVEIGERSNDQDNESNSSEDSNMFFIWHGKKYPMKSFERYIANKEIQK